MGIEHTDIVNAIIAGIGSNDNALDQMVQILANLEHAGFVIVPRAVLREAPCPGGGFNGMPKDAEPTVALCIDHGVCGCTFGAALEQKGNES